MRIPARSEVKEELKSNLDDEKESAYQVESDLIVPPGFECPITDEIMQDPVIALDGISYERAAIQEWFGRGNHLSPVTHTKLPNLTLIPNISLRKAIQEFVAKRPILQREAISQKDLLLAIQLREEELAAALRKAQKREEILTKALQEEKQKFAQQASMAAGLPSERKEDKEVPQIKRPRSILYDNWEGKSGNPIETLIRLNDVLDYWDPVMLHNQGLVLVKIGRYIEALESFTRSLEIGGDNVYTRCNIADVLFRLNQPLRSFRASEMVYERALKLDLKDSEFFTFLGDLFFKLVSYKQEDYLLALALECYNKSLQIKPDDPYTLKRSKLIFNSKDQNSTDQRDPQLYHFLEEMSQIVTEEHQRIKDIEKRQYISIELAKEHYKKMLESEKRQDISLGLTEEHKEKKHEAKRPAAGKDSSSVSQTGLFTIDKERKALSEEISACEAKLTKDPHNVEIRVSYALALYRFGHFDAALANIEQALECKQDHALALAGKQLIQQAIQKIPGITSKEKDPQTNIEKKNQL